MVAMLFDKWNSKLKILTNIFTTKVGQLENCNQKVIIVINDNVSGSRYTRPIRLQNNRETKILILEVCMCLCASVCSLWISLCLKKDTVSS